MSRGIPNKPSMINAEQIQRELHRLMRAQDGLIEQAASRIRGADYHTLYSRLTKNRSLDWETLSTCILVLKLNGIATRSLQRMLLCSGLVIALDPELELEHKDPLTELMDVPVEVGRLVERFQACASPDSENGKDLSPAEVAGLIECIDKTFLELRELKSSLPKFD